MVQIMAKTKKSTKEKTKKQNQVQVPEAENQTTKVLSRLSPIGLQRDGRMYYQSDDGTILTVSKMPYLALRSVLRYLEDKDSLVYEYLVAETKDGDIEPVRQQLQAQLEPAGKKCERAFQRLKEKGLYANTISGLRNLMQNYLPVNLGWPMDIILDMNLGMTGLEGWDADISDSVWLNALELSVYLFQRESYLRSEDTIQWGLYVTQNIEFIWILTYLTAYGEALRFDMLHAKSEIDNAKTRVMQIAVLNDTIRSLESTIQSQADELSKKREQHDSELRGLRTDNGRLASENRKLKLKLELMESSIAEAEFEANQEFTAEDLEFDETHAESDSGTYQFQLPEENVLFVGGHIRLQNKLRQLHPKWKFVTTKMSYSLLDDNVKSRFVFMYTGHLSHKLFDKVRQSLECVPMAYVTSQNLNLLHDEMLKAYNEYYENKGVPEY